ncbi:unnamed protein product [Urochloa humidicola]
MMNGSGDQQHNTVSLPRSLVLTQDTCIPSLLILGKLICASDIAIDMGSLRARLLQDWAPSGTVNLWPVTSGAFLVQLHEEADLRTAMDGAPWCCGSGHLFLMQQLKPETNLLDQLAGAGFATADLWVQFHNVLVQCFSPASLGLLATRIGVPVVCSPNWARRRPRCSVLVSGSTSRGPSSSPSPSSWTTPGVSISGIRANPELVQVMWYNRSSSWPLSQGKPADGSGGDRRYYHRTFTLTSR